MSAPQYRLLQKSLSRIPCFLVLLALALQAATGGAIVAEIPWRSGSYTSPLTQRQCSKTASFRATATAARFFAFFPPRSQSRSPYRRKSVSGPNGPKIYCALPTSSLRTIVSPVLLIPNCGWLSPESSCFGTNPRYGPTSRLLANRSGFSNVNTYASAVIGPTPFTCRNNFVCGYFSLPSFSIVSSYALMQVPSVSTNCTNGCSTSRTAAGSASP